VRSDGKAVGVVAVGGKYVEIAGQKYWQTAAIGYGVKANNVCPWHAFLTSAEIYDIRVIHAKGYPLRRVSTASNTHFY